MLLKTGTTGQMEAIGTLTKTLNEPWTAESCKTNVEQADNCLACLLSCGQDEVMTARPSCVGPWLQVHEKEQGVETPHSPSEEEPINPRSA